jgi:hypothetical protein
MKMLHFAVLEGVLAEPAGPNESAFIRHPSTHPPAPTAPVSTPMVSANPLGTVCGTDATDGAQWVGATATSTATAVGARTASVATRTTTA